jgi:methionyl aminopeptidase
MLTTKSGAELEVMHRANTLVLQILRELGERATPGVTTGDLDDYAHDRLRQEKVRSAFLGYRGYPKVLCASVNDEVVHGIPSRKKVLRSGDVIGLDFGLVVDGFYGDAALTFAVGKVSDEAVRLMQVTDRAMRAGIAAMLPGNRVSDVSRAVQTTVEMEGFSVVREFVGHGIGTAMHEDPPVPNYVAGGNDPRLVAGMVLAIEPMVNVGRAEVKVASDGWTASTRDGSLSAHFERSVAVTAAGPRVLGEDEAVPARG